MPPFLIKKKNPFHGSSRLSEGKCNDCFRTKKTFYKITEQSTTCTCTENVTWTPTSSYNAAGTKTASGTVSCTVTVEANVKTGLFSSGFSITNTDNFYVNGAVGSEGFLDGYFTATGDHYWTSGSEADFTKIKIPLSKFYLYDITLETSQPDIIEIGNDGILRLKAALTEIISVDCYVYRSGSFAIGFSFNLTPLSSCPTTLTYNTIPWEAASGHYGTLRGKGITTAILESNQRYMPWPVYIPFEMPYGTDNGTIQIPNSGSYGGDPTNGVYSVVSVTLGSQSLTSSSTTIRFSGGVPTPSTLTLS